MVAVDQLDEDGTLLCRRALSPAACDALEVAIAALPVDVPGVRIANASGLRDLLGPTGAAGRCAAAILGNGARPVRAVLFDKSAANNWSLGWHQDRTIVVTARADVPGYGPWTVKSGLVQVEPPFSLIEAMVTLRVHLDPVDADNAPLRIVPGSHRLGRLTEDAIAGVVETFGTRDCLAARGDIWIYRTAVVHGSRAASIPRRRRVLQIDYSADTLPPPLVWRGVV